MPGNTPVGADAHFDVPLSNFAVSAFADPQDQFIAEQLYPEVPVAKQSDKYYVIEKDAFLRQPDTLRSPKTRANKVEFTITSDSYYAHNYALSTDNAIEDLENADLAIQLRRNSTRLVVSNLRLDQEIRVANQITSISNVGSGVALTGSNKWSDGASDPIGDVNTGHAFMQSRTGLVANTLVLDWNTFKVVRRHPAILDLFKYTSGGQTTVEQLREAFDVERILIGRGIKNTAAEGKAPSMGSIWGNSAILAHVGQATGMESKTFGLRFRWRNPIFPADFGVQTDVKNRAGEEKVEVLEAGYFQDERIVAGELAYAITGTI